MAIVNPDDKEELALTIDAKKAEFNRARFVRFGEGLGLTDRQIKGTFNRLIRNKELALRLIDFSYVSEKYKQDYRDLLELRYERIRVEN